MPKAELFEFHERKDAFSLLTPASANIEVESVASTLAPSDDVVRFAVRFGPARFKFENVHTLYEPSERFVDEQRKGPYKFWYHYHEIEETDSGTKITDVVHYDIPYSIFGKLVHAIFIKNKLKEIFDFRSAKFKELLNHYS